MDRLQLAAGCCLRLRNRRHSSPSRIRPKLSCPPKRGLNVGRAMSKEGLSVAVERGCGGTSLAVDWSLAHVVGEGFV
jgi:hypothetical protein